LKVKGGMNFKGHRVLHLRDLTPDHVDHLERELLRHKPTVLLINSGGGDILLGHRLCAAISNHRKVIAIVTGVCSSMALPVLLSCSERYALRGARFHLHSVSCKKKIKYLDFERKRRAARKRRMWLAQQKAFENSIAQKTSLSPKKVRRYCRRRKALSAKKALACGIIDAICGLVLSI